MSETNFPLGSELAVQMWSPALAIEAPKFQYTNRFMGTGKDACIRMLKELEKKAGEKITYGLREKLSGEGIEGDNDIEGTSAEEGLNFYPDSLFVDQVRKGTKSKGKMSEQRVLYNIRKESKDALAVWFGEWYDEQVFMYLSGARGVDTSFKVNLAFTGRANNSLEAPDADHLIYGGNATAKLDVDSSDTMSLTVVEKLLAHSKTVDPMIQPLMFNGKQHFVLTMHTFQAYQLRTSTTTNDWVDIQKNAGERGLKNPVFQDSLGIYGGVILHEHRNIIRFSDYGSGSNLPAARALFLGAQAGVIAWGGDGGKNRYSWNEESDDRGNKAVITAGTICAVKKCVFNSKAFGVVAVDTYCANPNA